MKKIGILTFHDTLNYGASLQCYALYRKLTLLGAEAEVVDYKCTRFKKEYSPFLISHPSLKKAAYMLIALKSNIIKQRKKRLFQKNFLKMSRVYQRSDIAEANNDYCAFITGSDQVWNWQLTDFDRTYFLDFVLPPNKKYSYAASIGISEIDQDKKAIYKELLSGYESMSVREEQGAKIVGDLLGKTPEVMADPVLLLSKDEWEAIEKKPEINGYVALYTINDTEAYEYAKMLAESTNRKLVYISAPIKKIGKFEKIIALGPSEFLGWINHADFIVTDSFHGTICSILFQKHFVTFLDRRKVNRNSRIENLMNQLGLDDRIVTNQLELDRIAEPIDYNCVGKVLENYVNRSVEYLKRIVRETNE